MSFKGIHPKTQELLDNLDKLRMTDSAYIINSDGTIDMLADSHGKRMIGEIIFETLDLNGNTLFTSEPEYNDIIITGSTMVLEKIFGVRANLSISTLSQDMNINSTVGPSLANLPQEQIVGFMVGIGGAGETIGDVKAVKYTDKALPSVVPFRAVTTPLSGADAAPYFMSGLVSGKTYYYGKKFDSTPVIRHLFTDGSEVPANISETGSTKGIRVFAESICVLSNKDIREYFMLVDGNIDKCRINSLGLVSGYPSNSDYGGVRLATTVNFRSRYLSNNDDAVRITYRMYCL